MELLVPWERTFDGRPARYVKGLSPIRSASLLSRNIAISKALDVSIISAEFNGTIRVFESAFLLLTEYEDRVLGLAVLPHSFSADERDKEEVGLPDICLRRTRWERGADDRGFRDAEDKVEYLKGKTHGQSEIRFYSSRELDIEELMKESSRVFRRGVALTEVQREGIEWQFLRCWLVDAGIEYRIHYVPFAFENVDLERLIRRWIELFGIIDIRSGAVPDDGCRISYELSIWEKIEKVRPHWE